MAIRTLTFALAAAALTVGTSAHAAAAVPARSSSPVGQAEQLGGSELIPVAVFMLAILAIMIFADSDDRPESP